MADSYNSYGHTYWTVTTLTSPSGRTSSVTSSQSNGYSAYARAETSLAWDWNDLGDYSTQSAHWMDCPYMGGNPYSPTQPSQGCFPFSHTSLAQKAGASHAGYYLTGFSFCCCSYAIVPDCHVRCGPPNVTTVQVLDCAGWVERLQPGTKLTG